MGLDFVIKKIDYDYDGCDARWSYGGFMEFRIRLAKEIGIDLKSMEGFIEDGNSWDDVEDDIKLFLNHSDCDGELHCENCEKVWPRLKELIKNWPDDDYDKVNALELVEAMKSCAENEWDLVFC